MTEATRKRLQLHNWAFFFFFPQDRDTLRGSQIQTWKGVQFERKCFRWYSISIFSTVLLGEKCSRLETVKRKMYLSLWIVTYAGFRFSPSKYSKAHLGNHFKITFYLTYLSFHTNFWSFLLSSCKNLTSAQFIPPTETSRGNLSSFYFLIIIFVMLIL